MTFLWPSMLLALLLVPVALALAGWIESRRRGRAALLTGLAHAGAGAPPQRALDRLPGALVVAAAVVLVVASARPQATVATPRLEGTVVLTFDVSGSMAAPDVEPSRMDAAKTVARAVAGTHRPGVVMGAVAFSNAGMAVQAPTSDSAAVLAAIDRLVPAEGTSLGDGIVATVEAIEASRAAAPADYYSNRPPEPTQAPSLGAGDDPATLIVLFSDGEDTAESDPIGAAGEAASRGIRIVTVGVGTAEGATLELDGFQVQSRLDEATLRAIADESGGVYLPLDERRVGAAIDDLLQRRLVTRSEPLELTALVAGVALVLLVAGASLSLARSGRLP